MTEDDTYRALRKIPFSDLKTKVHEVPDNEWVIKSDQQHDDWFFHYGWTYQEYVTATIKEIKDFSQFAR